MKKALLTAFFVMLSCSTVFAASNLTTDDSGNTTGTIDGKKVNLHTDKDGTTKGTIGSARINTRTDQLGNTTGTMGKNTINTNIIQTDNGANANNQMPGAKGRTSLNPRQSNVNVTPGAINNSILNTYTENPGNTSGKGGYKNINKRSNEALGDSF